MNLGDIEAFVAVAETGSINRAALRLGLTQPAITRRVQNFEATMGSAALLDRSAKPPALTLEGRQALEYCRRVLKAVTELEASASPAGAHVGPLRIGIAHSLAEVVLSEPLDDLRQRFPDLRLHVSSHWTTELIEAVRNGGLDCAIALTTHHHRIPSGATVVPIGSEEVAVVSARDGKSAGASTGRLRIRDLADKAWVLNPPPCGYRSALHHAFDRQRLTMHVAADVLGYDLQLSLIARGVGLGLVPRRRLRASMLRRSLRILDVADFTLEGGIALVHGPTLASLGPSVTYLRERLVARLH